MNSLAILVVSSLVAAPVETKGKLVLEADPQARFTFAGTVGNRSQANIDQWLVIAPNANPGMLQMFRVRDRQPVPNLVPWAGEFVGKYLISAIQALRMTDDPRLESTVRTVIADLIKTQADDGYLGPFRKHERLLGHWDLWGHYHVMLALLMWHERTGDETALAATRKAADLVCATFLNTGKRVFDAGSPEMNMAILTTLGWLYRMTGEDKYLWMMKEVEADWQREGDYFRAGLAGVDFYRTPRPRWESLHCVQGLIELYRITGDEKYKTAFINLWRSIRDYDLRNTGGFSSGEQASGNPYEDTAIETCCSIAWMALCLDALRVTADASVADIIELGFYNAILGAQHPTGRWWTYNTPMNGVREASAHTIVFQSRAGTPELNCCSVNAPRGLGMLTEWAILRDAAGLYLNYLGPMASTIKLADGTPTTIQTETNYPESGDIKITVTPKEPRTFHFRIRVPHWAKGAKIDAPQGISTKIENGYANLSGEWKGQTVRVRLNNLVHYEAGDIEQAGKASIYWGPVLLTYDPAFNEFDENDLPAIDVDQLNSLETVSTQPFHGPTAPWLLRRLSHDGKTVTLCDFASAGQSGTRYRSWLPATALPPPMPALDEPRSEVAIPPGPAVFSWRSSPSLGNVSLIVAEDENFQQPIIRVDGVKESRLVLPEEEAKKLSAGRGYFWRIESKNDFGVAASRPAYRRVRIDASLPRLKPEDLAPFGEKSDGVVVEDLLSGSAMPSHGQLARVQGASSAMGPNESGDGAVALGGDRPIIIYKLRRFPETDYTASIWVRLEEPTKRLSQVVSAWAKGSDDPLRICVEGDEVFARIEGGAGASTEGRPLPLKRWVHVAGVKSGPTLSLYLDGKLAAQAHAPRRLLSGSKAIAVGGNPLYGGDESLAGQFSHFVFFARALSPEEIAKLAAKGER